MKKKAAETIPDTLGSEGDAGIALDTLAEVQDQIKRLEQLRILNDASPKDPVPGLPPGPDGEVITYAERRKLLKDGEQRVFEANADVMDEVRALIRRRERQAQARALMAEEE